MPTIKLCLCAIVFVGAVSRSRDIVLPARRDVWLSSYPTEQRFNMGRAPKLKLKITQEFSLIDFDVSALGNHPARKAWLHVKAAGGGRFGLNGATDFTWLVVSTVAHEWTEGLSPHYAEDPRGHGATFLESSSGRDDWGWPGATTCDVILGNGHTRRCQGRLEPTGDEGWFRMPIDVELVWALQAGASHGLCLMDGATQVQVNCCIASRESGQGPYLTVEPGELLTEPPAAPTHLAAHAHPAGADASHGALVLRLTVPRGAFSYDITIDDHAVERWQIPFAAATDNTQEIPLVDLPPDRDVSLAIRAVGRSGRRSPWVRLTAHTSPALHCPPLPHRTTSAPQPTAPPRLGRQARVWAAPALTKIDPVSGKVLFESPAGDARQGNPVWDSPARTIRIEAPRAGFASFQLLFEGRIRKGHIAFSPLQNTRHATVPAKAIRLWRTWYVGGIPEIALPLHGPIQCPWPDNAVPGQKLQSVVVDIAIPARLPPGLYRTTITCSDEDAVTRLALHVNVHRATLPDTIFFNPELNCYGGPGRAGSERFRDSFRLAHYHRCTIDRVPYSQSGRTHADWAPLVAPDGRVTDWTPFDTSLGGLLDGSWFAGNPRDGVPVPTLYLPLSDSFPLNFRDYYHPGSHVPTDCRDPVQRLKHDAWALPPEKALSPAFGQALQRCARDFSRHLGEKGWHRTLFEFYLNNKPKYGYTVWTLDEPTKYRDWAALNYFARRFKTAIDDPVIYTPAWHRDLYRCGLGAMNRGRASLVFRGDVSRPQWQGSVSDGLMTFMVVNNGMFRYTRLMANHRERIPTTFYCYGSCNAVDRANWETVAWCLKAFVHGADGVVPWQSLAGEKALRQADTNGLIIDAGAHGHAVASLRVHALREGAELCEMLRLLQLANDWNRETCRLLLAQRVDLDARFEQKQADEAAAVTFAGLDTTSFLELKWGILTLLDQARD